MFGLINGNDSNLSFFLNLAIPINMGIEGPAGVKAVRRCGGLGFHHQDKTSANPQVDRNRR